MGIFPADAHRFRRGGAAAGAKGLFRDKLPPQWQFSVWGLLGAVLAVPAGLWGRYVLVDWPWLVETAKTLLTGDDGLTRVTAPIPRRRRSCRRRLRNGCSACIWRGCWDRWAGTDAPISACGRPCGRAFRQSRSRWSGWRRSTGFPSAGPSRFRGIPSALVCGVLRPVLVLPAGQDVDDKVLLHELLHLKQRDTLWGMVICVFRCIHWCNPLLQYCAGRAANDLESRCDQRVLERLEGEERRNTAGSRRR